ncbi:hypothetical protein DPMN_065282 [Dreissena polymorpha]|uniref:Uncharacterized protein n=1 Tax=Dreissena polymorpha TaxID=45954 RepID=A0A9D4CF32_DREPO|nr:hypothetical protein DPMN_065282 [Dreissena polymorpha]
MINFSGEEAYVCSRVRHRLRVRVHARALTHRRARAAPADSPTSAPPRTAQDVEIYDDAQSSSGDESTDLRTHLTREYCLTLDPNARVMKAAKAVSNEDNKCYKNINILSFFNT